MNVTDRILNVSQVRRTELLDLGDFDEAYRGAIFEIWVTPPAGHRKQLEEMQLWLERETERARRDRDAIRDPEKRALFDTETANKLDAEWEERLLRWLAETWLNVDLDEARRIRTHLIETNPVAWEWLFQHTTLTIGNFKRRAVGNSRGG